MKKDLSCLALILMFTFKIQATEIHPYLSPGVTLAWYSKGLKSATWKISLGIFCDVNSENLNGYFINLTYGKRFLLNDYKRDYRFTECESGIFCRYLVYGTGLGAAYFKTENKTRIVPKGAFFIGNILFLRSDFIIDNKKTDWDLGANLVYPISTTYWDYLKSYARDSDF